MKLRILLLSLLLPYAFYSQSPIRELKYNYYTSWFSTAEHIPLVVSYTLTGDMLSCATHLKRSNKFKPDPLHKDITNLARDYRNSGYDKGHNMNAADNECSEKGMQECFYFSNMTPQPHAFNAGRWEDLEKQERTEALQQHTLIVTCGSLGIKTHIGPDSVAVPKEMWKVIYIPSSDNYQCYLFPNSEDVNKELAAYKVSLNKIETLASLGFTKGVVKMKETKEGLKKD